MSNLNYNSCYHFSQVPSVPVNLPPGYQTQTQGHHLQQSSYPSQTSPVGENGTNLVSASVKLICPNEKQSEHRVFMLRDIDIGDIMTLGSLREEISIQFGDEFIDGNSDFDVGYFKGNKRIWIRNDNDLKDLTKLLKSKGVTLWCNGKRKSRKRASDSSDSEEDCARPKKKKRSASKERTDRVDDVTDELRLKHKSAFTSLQYRVWAETVVAGRHDSLDHPPRGSYFKTRNVQSPEPAVNKPATAITPIRAADLKSTYIKQIKELHSLFEIGAITETDYQKQKKVILDQMDKL